MDPLTHIMENQIQQLQSSIYSTPISTSKLALARNNETDLSQVKDKVSSDSEILKKLKMFENMCENLQKQVDDLKKENHELKISLQQFTDQNTPKPAEFHTDEEELARETDWILNKPRKAKKRKADRSPDIGSEPAGTLNPIKNQVKTNKPKLPPVILSNINDFNQVQYLMSSQNIKYEVKVLNNKQLSIKVTSESDYRNLTKAITDAKFEWHSYENKNTRPIKVIARGLHPSCKPELILDDLKQKGFSVLSVVNLTMKKKVNEKQIVEKLPLFMLTFDHSEDIQKIFSIAYIVNTKVKIEAIKKPRNQVPQCKRCQRFEHTKAFCQREARCVRCAGCHLTTDCTQDKNVPPKCSNCNEAHPANYRGCVVAKELQKRRAAKKKVDAPKPKAAEVQKPKQNIHIHTPSKTRTGSWADVVRKNSVVPSRQKSQRKLTLNDDPTSIFDLLLSKIDEISSRLEKIEKRYANNHIEPPRSILKK